MQVKLDLESKQKVDCSIIGTEICLQIELEENNTLGWNILYINILHDIALLQYFVIK